MNCFVCCFVLFSTSTRSLQGLLKMSSEAEGFVQNPFHTVCEPVPAEPPLWTYYKQPIILAVIGALALCTGIVFYLLTEFGVADVPHGVGPVCLSVGVMFFVVALVMLPIIKDKLRRRGPKTRRMFHMDQVWNADGPHWPAEQFYLPITQKIKVQDVRSKAQSGWSLTCPFI